MPKAKSAFIPVEHFQFIFFAIEKRKTLSEYGSFFILLSTITDNVLMDFLKSVAPGRRYTFLFPGFSSIGSN
ncbi:hypothetical protein LEP1GSC008_3799 [Leptospira kirschneri serovar Bulgarica str. Nikolaevo]|uniref:Uncharacterized protein n=1 Tax=Leptospira kirschneri serovar Bulgarica str. Nikolaevo TaxID=1240687 RepID=M6FCC3_9LEPT|nr:hypothetical protein LEP1GSC008_3374 [Leptospira kirschneri serovar Bulgarica str. Nikolaevo]EMK25627.1 hypothetical protein LEP1GSC008_3799 [Leptospira kirschneri serovar Bulgarica str. Nikolaevo]